MRQSIVLALSLIAAEVVILTSGCTNGAAHPTAATYYARLQEINATFDAKSLASIVRLSESNSPEGDKAGLELYADGTKAFDADLKSVTPPAELGDLHVQFTAAVQDMERSVDAYASNRVRGQTEQDIAPFVMDFRRKALAVTDACGQLQSRADANHISVNLRCQTLTHDNPDHPATPGSSAPTAGP